MKNFFFLFVIISTSLFCQDLREISGFERTDPSKIDQLVSMSYYAPFRLGYGAGEYLDENFGLSTKNANQQSITWVTTRGTYNEYHGYWIFRPNINQCWEVDFG